MNVCLLCQGSLQKKNQYVSLFFLHRERKGICQVCKESFEKISVKHCDYCFKEGISGACLDCQTWESQGKAVHHQSLFTYNSAMKSYFSSYKFQGDYLLRHAFSEEIKLALKTFKDYTIVPIPVSPERYHSRGFNQVEGLLDAAGLSYKRLLRKEDSQSQSSKTREERLSSSQVFRLQENVALPNKILLFDDIYTTGTTLQLAKELLQENGVEMMVTFSLAR